MVSKTKPQRNANGTFAKGWKGGPGRPPREVELEYLAAFRQACSPADLAAVVATVVMLAKSGDMVAAKLLLSHALPISARLELLNFTPPELAYRVAGMTASEVDNTMLRRLVDSIKDTRRRDAEQNN
jgi:N-acetylglucosamine kinase-like BadF-type ATPase